MWFPALLLAAATMLPIPLQVGGVGCASVPSLEVAAEGAAAVFVGEARGVTPTSDSVTFDVDWQWKGRQMPATVEVHVIAIDGLNATDDLAPSAASRTFATGRTYLVFTQNAFSPFIVDACSGSAPYSGGSIIPPSLWEPLGDSEARPPSPTPPAIVRAQPPTFNAMAAAAMVGVTVLILGRILWGWLRKRRERRAAGPLPRKMRRRDRAWLAEQEELESAKPTSGDRELQKLRETWRKRRKKKVRSATKVAESAKKERVTAGSYRATSDATLLSDPQDRSGY